MRCTVPLNGLTIDMTKADSIERLVIKIPKSVADYFRSAFPHGKRSEFLAKCILDYKHQEEIKQMEDDLREAAKNRQE